jgi:hypothetical protein
MEIFLGSLMNESNCISWPSQQWVIYKI